MSIENLVELKLELIVEHCEAQALSQLVKRIGWSEFRSLSKSADEAHNMRDAVCKLQGALAVAGYDPR